MDQKYIKSLDKRISAVEYKLNALEYYLETSRDISAQLGLDTTDYDAVLKQFKEINYAMGY